MMLYPAIDLMGGKCVRLTRGIKENRTDYSDHPEEMAVRWLREGAKWLHVIDLDGAIDQNCFANRDAIRAILAVVDVPVQIGGGIREAAQVQRYLDDGVARVIVGTSVLESRDFARELFSEFGEKIAVSIDSANGKVALKGWTDYSDLKTVDAATRMQDDGAKVIIFTDIIKDGTLSEPNFDMMDKVASALEIDVIAAGGVSDVDHIRKLKELKHDNIEGAIIGKALYTGDFDLKTAIKLYQD